MRNMKVRQPVGIIAAMDEELSEYLGMMEERRTVRVLDVDFYEGSIGGVPVVAAKCGIGKVNSAMIAAMAIMKFSVKALINTGVAGGIGIDTLSVVVGVNSVQYDFDTTAFGDPKGLVDGFDSVYIPADAELCKTFGKVLEGAYFGTIASADRFVTDDETITMLKNEYAALACDFETAAVYQVAARAGVPAVSLRVISDGNGNHSVADYETFKKIASDKAAKAVAAALIKL